MTGFIYSALGDDTYTDPAAPEDAGQLAEIAARDYIAAVGTDHPFAVYVRMPRGEYVARNHDAESAVQAAGRWARDGYPVHVSIDTCG